MSRRGQGSLTYTEVGATAGDLPRGYDHLDRTVAVGVGGAWFRTAAERLLTWGMHRRAGLRVDAEATAITGGTAVLRVPLGPVALAAPVLVVEVVEEPDHVVLTYGTRAGHPECGEERFSLTLRPTGEVDLQIRAFSRPARWFTRLGRPVARQVQLAITERYVSALTAPNREA